MVGAARGRRQGLFRALSRADVRAGPGDRDRVVRIAEDREQAEQRRVAAEAEPPRRTSSRCSASSLPPSRLRSRTVPARVRIGSRLRTAIRRSATRRRRRKRRPGRAGPRQRAVSVGDAAADGWPDLRTRNDLRAVAGGSVGVEGDQGRPGQHRDAPVPTRRRARATPVRYGTTTGAAQRCRPRQLPQPRHPGRRCRPDVRPPSRGAAPGIGSAGLARHGVGRQREAARRAPAYRQVRRPARDRRRHGSAVPRRRP